VNAFTVAGPLRGFAWARLGVSIVLLAIAPLVTPGSVMPGENQILALTLIIALTSSSAMLLLGPPAQPRRLAWFICLLDTALITAVVAATGGARSIFAFLYVLSVTAACVMLSRTRGLAIAAISSVLYTGIVMARTVLPLSVFFDTPQETTALELVTMFLNAATLLVVAIVAGGLGERYRATSQELETRQRDLRDLQAFKDLIFQSVGTGLIALDRAHRITALNRAAEEITGVTAVQAIGHEWPALIGAVVPLDSIEAAIDGNPRVSRRHETTLRRPDGSSVPVRMTFSALRSGEGERLGLISACEDLSAIREMESRMRQADRLATLGRMAANIAHEIRNPLASLTGAIEVLTSPLTADDARERLSQIVATESERLNHIIKNFLEYARPAPLSITAFDVAAAAEEVLLLLEHRAGPGSLKVVRAFPPSVVWPVDAQQFRQVLWNLCLNAVEAMPEGGELRVNADVRGDRLEVSVSDNGEGIAATDLSHVFEPFFSTKSEGTGLGLALVHRVVQEHGGEIDVQSTPGLGTTFTLTLPSRHA
jgi:two-component system sensor histidine kinase PilS (NtrC family)